jgi:type IV pilus assembly protein PilC
MATAALSKNAKEMIFEWEGKDKNGKVVRGEMRAGGEAVVNASLRRQGILITRSGSAAPAAGGRSSRRTSPSSRGNWPP